MHNKRLAAKILKTSPHKIRFQPEALEEIQKAITRADVRGLIAVGKISRTKPNLHSRAHARKIKLQRRKGRHKAEGARKGSPHSRLSKKDRWVNRVRSQRHFLQQLRDKNILSREEYRLLYVKCKGGYFRNIRHIKLHLGKSSEAGMVKK